MIGDVGHCLVLNRGADVANVGYAEQNQAAVAVGHGCYALGDPWCELRLEIERSEPGRDAGRSRGKASKGGLLGWLTK